MGTNLSMQKQLLELLHPAVSGSEESRKALYRRINRFSARSVEELLVRTEALNPKCLSVVRTVVQDAMNSVSSPTSSELETRLRYALSGAKTMAAFVFADYYTIVLVDLMHRCIKLGFTDPIDLTKPDTPHVEVWRGMIIEDAIVNYAFEEPQYYEYLGENADALLPHAEILTGDAPAGHHRVSMERVEFLLAGGAPKLLEGVL